MKSISGKSVVKTGKKKPKERERRKVSAGVADPEDTESLLTDSVIEDLMKPSERLKTEEEIEEELRPMKSQLAWFEQEVARLKREILELECTWGNRHLILTTAPPPISPLPARVPAS